MEIVKVPTPSKSYEIIIGENVAKKISVLENFNKVSKIILVSNPTIMSLHRNTIMSSISSTNYVEFLMEDGEVHKNIKSFDQLCTFMLKNKMDRNSLMLAFGGGVVGDLAGFAASTYQRGINYAQIPTTLLAQVDSSVGGKTAINHALGKNMIGAFYQPSVVLSDVSFLKTLPEREFSSGLSEVVKYGLIRDENFFSWIEDNIKGILNRETSTLVQMVKKSCENKRDIVAADERESGVRALLNLGHTFGHAIEKLTGYKKWLHGEAVSIGITMASRASHEAGMLDNTSLCKIENILKKLNLPTKDTNCFSTQTMLEAMSNDKKNSNGKIKLVLLSKIGRAVITDDFDQSILPKAISNL